MAALTKTRLAQTDDQFGASFQECMRRFDAASKFLSEAHGLIVSSVKFIRAHWDEEFERRLSRSGFRGSLFILQEWRIHLETIKAHLTPVLSDFTRTAETGASKGWGDIRREAEQHDPVLGSATRPLCRAVVEFADFEDRVAQTAIVFNEYEQAKRQVKRGS